MRLTTRSCRLGDTISGRMKQWRSSGLTVGCAIGLPAFGDGPVWCRKHSRWSTPPSHCLPPTTSIEQRQNSPCHWLLNTLIAPATPLLPKVPTCRAELAGSDTGEGSAFNQSLVDFQSTGTREVSGAGRSVRRLPLRIEGVGRRPLIIRTRHGLRILKRSIPVSDAYPRLCRGIESR